MKVFLPKFYIHYIALFKMTITIMLCFFCITNLNGCDHEIDYSEDKNYAHLFSAEDDTATKELKNSIVSQIVAYNKGDASGYYALFEMEKSDRNFNIAEYKSLWSKYTLSHAIEEMEYAFASETDAQVLLTLRAKAVSRSDGSELYNYLMETTYTMSKKSGEWKITTQSNSHIIG